MDMRSVKERAITSNYAAFEAMLPLLLQQHSGEFALLRDGDVVGFFPTAGAAQAAGSAQFADRAFSIQKVEDKAIDLGFYSYARYRRSA